MNQIFDFAQDYQLEDDYIRLSPLQTTHIQSLLQWASNPAIWTYFLENGCGREELTQYIESTIANRQAGKEYPFVVFDKVQQQYAGTTRLYDIIPDLGNLKIGHTWYGQPFHGTGLNKHCKYLLFEFAFETLGMQRIGFGAHAENQISIRAMKSIGCQVEGYLRSFLPSIHGPGRADIILMSILREAWLGEWKMKLQKKLRPPRSQH